MQRACHPGGTGVASLAEAAREAQTCERSGDTERAKFWTRVETVLREMRGPRQT
ncbi:MAG TPA: hypothetical protein VNU64_24095 [Burkholderiales bacterium]|nr:hypothetical protein [Burkholderiales bacterium]